MKTYKMSKDEMAIVAFHAGVRQFHEATLNNYIRNTVARRLGIPLESSIQYDPAKGEVYVQDKHKIYTGVGSKGGDKPRPQPRNLRPNPKGKGGHSKGRKKR